MKEITRIPLEGLHNTRDLGGFETADGRKIRPRRLIRSGQLSGMTEKDKQVLTEDYGLRTDVDFRTGQERTEAPDPRLPGVAYVENPILSDQAIGITREKDSEEDMMKLLVQQMSTSERRRRNTWQDCTAILSWILFPGSSTGSFSGFFSIRRKAPSSGTAAPARTGSA